MSGATIGAGRYAGVAHHATLARFVAGRDAGRTCRHATDAPDSATETLCDGRVLDAAARYRSGPCRMLRREGRYTSRRGTIDDHSDVGQHGPSDAGQRCDADRSVN